MKRVRLEQLITGPRGRFAAGEEIHVADDEAEQLIAAHAAVEAPEELPGTAAAVAAALAAAKADVGEEVEDEMLEAPENADGLPTRRGRRR